MTNLTNRYGLLLASAIIFVLTPQARANLITNGNFGTVTPAMSTNEICTTNTKVYPYTACSAAGWSGLYQVGNGSTIGIFGVSFNIPQPDPGGSSQALILQSGVESGLPITPTATQSITITTSGTYALTFDLANRNTPGFPVNGPQTVTVLLDGVPISGGTYSKLPTGWTPEALDFSVSSGTYSLTFQGLTETTGDISAFVDDISLNPKTSPVPEPGSLALIAIGLTALAVGRKRILQKSPEAGKQMARD
jgi:hypothetical protein